MNVYSISVSPRRLGFIALSLLLVLSLLAISLPVSALAAQNAATCSTNYTVKSGDTLSKISVTYNVSVAEIANANGLKEPYTLYVGQVLCIPGSAAATTTASAGSSKNEKISATFTDTKVTLKLSGLRKNGVYYVRARKYVRGSDNWYKFGIVKMSKSGTATVTFPLPRNLRDFTYLQICVKEGTNNTVQCSRFRR
jgi:LysM repeat protein